MMQAWDIRNALKSPSIPVISNMLRVLMIARSLSNGNSKDYKILQSMGEKLRDHPSWDLTAKQTDYAAALMLRQGLDKELHRIVKLLELSNIPVRLDEVRWANRPSTIVNIGACLAGGEPRYPSLWPDAKIADTQAALAPVEPPEPEPDPRELNPHWGMF